VRVQDRASVGRTTRVYEVKRERTGPAGSAETGQAQPTTDLSFLGVPEEELTPSVRSALASLLDETAQLGREVEALRERLRKAESLADEDPLVPVRNRRSFVRELQRMIAYAHRQKHPVSLLLLDLNGLKTINDTGGHAAGDAAIKEVAATLVAHTRASDLVGRLGGDEFGVVLMDMDRDGAEDAAQRLTAEIALKEIELPNGWVPLSAACGVCTFDGDMTTEDALHQADMDMYRRKHAERA
jgi:diguanylate cyclase (GGDEF)-like protein